MMRQLFISFDGKLQPRWLKAFPNAEVIAASQASMSTDMADIVWLDISRHEQAAAEELLHQIVRPSQVVVVMTNYLSEQEARWVMRSGAMGYCHYLASDKQLVEVSDVVKRGGLWVGEQLLQKILSVLASLEEQSQKVESEINAMEQLLSVLTDREKMVAEQAAKGSSNKMIARELDITERTVKAHMSSIFTKLNVRDRVQLALLLNNASSGKDSEPLYFSTMV